MPETMRDAILQWYIFLSSLSAGVTQGVGSLDQRIGIPLVSAFSLGVIGAAAPCQLTTGLAALGLLGPARPGRSRGRDVLAYLVGKAAVYSAFGLVAVAAGAGLSQVSIPVFVAARKALGPLMIVAGLLAAGALRLSWVPGAALALRLRRTVGQRAERAPFLLGVAFGFSFCPTLFGLFFGLLIPLAVTRLDGALYPALFAVGTTLPLLAVVALLSSGGGSARRYVASIGRAQKVAALLAGVLLVLVGLHDTVVYWLL